MEVPALSHSDACHALPATQHWELQMIKLDRKDIFVSWTALCGNNRAPGERMLWWKHPVILVGAKFLPLFPLCMFPVGAADLETLLSARQEGSQSCHDLSLPPSRAVRKYNSVV